MEKCDFISANSKIGRTEWKWRANLNPLQIHVKAGNKRNKIDGGK